VDRHSRREGVSTRPEIVMFTLVRTDPDFLANSQPSRWLIPGSTVNLLGDAFEATRVGNVHVMPFLGLPLDQLWVQ
jgi:hypothetical protein